MHFIVVTLWLAVCNLLPVLAYSNITFYSDTRCSQYLYEVTGPDDGTCTPFSSDAVGYGSFKVTSLDQTCAVTIYGNDVSYCSSATLSLASFSDCLTNVTVNQFSVDCQDYSVAISSTPQVVPIGADPPQTSTTSTSSGLSDGAKAGIAVASSVVGVLLIGLFVFFVIMRANRRRREHLQMTSLNEADTISAAAPPYSELPHDEKKAPVELPSRASHPVEAPGDQNWPLAHELPVEELSSEVDGSATTLRDDLPVEVKEKDVKTNPESERQA